MSQTQHEDSIQWREWGAEAFAEARARDVPVLLDIGAVWCHWCHVMDTGLPGDPVHTGTYSDPDVQARIRERFVAVKVDTDKRPDVNARYNCGGWPTTAFLTPDGEALYGETYVPAPRMMSLLDYIHDLWTTNRAELDAQTAQMRSQRAQGSLPEAPPSARALDPHTIPFVLRAISHAYDPVYGGLGKAPKFPHPDALLLTLEQCIRTDDDHLREIVVTTLRGMAQGGMYDKYAGGFFRYSTTRDWSVPHYEKMLEDNARLCRVYLLAARALELPEFADTARHTLGWLLETMRDPETSAFAGSQDADGEERYYGKPLHERAKLPTPFIDRTTYAGWNALMVSALVTAYQVTGEQNYLDAARATLAFVEGHLTHGRGDLAAITALRHYCANGQAGGTTGLLSDQSAFVHAALDLHEATGERRYQMAAAEAADYILEYLQDAASGLLRDAPIQPDAPGALSRPHFDLSDNADAALALLRLSALTEHNHYRDAATRVLAGWTGEYANYRYAAASYARAVDAAVSPPVHLILTGEGGDALRALQQAAWTLLLPGAAVETLPPTEAAQRGFPPADNGAARAYVCLGTHCLAPAETPDALRALVAEALKRDFGTSP